MLLSVLAPPQETGTAAPLHVTQTEERERKKVVSRDKVRRYMYEYLVKTCHLLMTCYAAGPSTGISPFLWQIGHQTAPPPVIQLVMK